MTTSVTIVDMDKKVRTVPLPVLKLPAYEREVGKGLAAMMRREQDAFRSGLEGEKHVKMSSVDDLFHDGGSEGMDAPMSQREESKLSQSQHRSSSDAYQRIMYYSDENYDSMTYTIPWESKVIRHNAKTLEFDVNDERGCQYKFGFEFLQLAVSLQSIDLKDDIKLLRQGIKPSPKYRLKPVVYLEILRRDQKEEEKKEAEGLHSSVAAGVGDFVGVRFHVFFPRLHVDDVMVVSRKSAGGSKRGGGVSDDTDADTGAPDEDRKQNFVNEWNISGRLNSFFTQQNKSKFTERLKGLSSSGGGVPTYSGFKRKDASKDSVMNISSFNRFASFYVDEYCLSQELVHKQTLYKTDTGDLQEWCSSEKTAGVFDHSDFNAEHHIFKRMPLFSFQRSCLLKGLSKEQQEDYSMVAGDKIARRHVYKLSTSVVCEADFNKYVMPFFQVCLSPSELDARYKAFVLLNKSIATRVEKYTAMLLALDDDRWQELFANKAKTKETIDEMADEFQEALEGVERLTKQQELFGDDNEKDKLQLERHRKVVDTHVAREKLMFEKRAIYSSASVSIEGYVANYDELKDKIKSMRRDTEAKIRENNAKSLKEYEELRCAQTFDNNEEWERQREQNKQARMESLARISSFCMKEGFIEEDLKEKQVNGIFDAAEFPELVLFNVQDAIMRKFDALCEEYMALFATYKKMYANEDNALTEEERAQRQVLVANEWENQRKANRRERLRCIGRSNALLQKHGIHLQDLQLKDDSDDSVLCRPGKFPPLARLPKSARDEFDKLRREYGVLYEEYTKQFAKEKNITNLEDRDKRMAQLYEDIHTQASDAMHEFKCKALDEFEDFMESDPQGVSSCDKTVWKFMKLMQKDRELEKKFLSFKKTLKFSNLSRLGNRIVGDQIAFEKSNKVMWNYMYLLIVLFTYMSVSDTETTLKLNLFLWGNKEVGKSYLFDLLNAIAIPDTVLSIAKITPGSFTVMGEEIADKILYMDDVPQHIFNESKSASEQVKVLQGLLKMAMTSGKKKQTTVECTFKTDPTTGEKRRVLQITESVLRVSFALSSNWDINPDDALASRTLVLNVPGNQDTNHTVRQHMLGSSITPNMNAQSVFDALTDCWRRDKCIFMCLYRAMALQIIEPVDTSIVQSYILNILANCNDMGLRDTFETRNFRRVMMLTTVSVILEAITTVFDLEDGALYCKPFRPRDLVYLEPYLVARKEHADLALQMCAQQYASSNTYELVEAVKSEWFSAFFHPDGSAVMEIADAKTKEEHMKLNMAILRFESPKEYLMSSDKNNDGCVDDNRVMVEVELKEAIVGNTVKILAMITQTLQKRVSFSADELQKELLYLMNSSVYAPYRDGSQKTYQYKKLTFHAFHKDDGTGGHTAMLRVIVDRKLLLNNLPTKFHKAILDEIEKLDTAMPTLFHTGVSSTSRFIVSQPRAVYAATAASNTTSSAFVRHDLELLQTLRNRFSATNKKNNNDQSLSMSQSQNSTNDAKSLKPQPEHKAYRVSNPNYIDADLRRSMSFHVSFDDNLRNSGSCGLLPLLDDRQWIEIDGDFDKACIVYFQQRSLIKKEIRATSSPVHAYEYMQKYIDDTDIRTHRFATYPEQEHSNKSMARIQVRKDKQSNKTFATNVTITSTSNTSNRASVAIKKKKKARSAAFASAMPAPASAVPAPAPVSVTSSLYAAASSSISNDNVPMEDVFEDWAI